MQETTPFLWFDDKAEEAECGWLKDKYGVSWLIAPAALGEMVSNPDPDVIRIHG